MHNVWRTDIHWVHTLIIGQKSCSLGPTIFEIPQPNCNQYAHIINIWKKLCALYSAFIQNCRTYFAALVWWTIDRISFLLIKKAAELCHPLLAQNLFHFQHMLYAMWCKSFWRNIYNIFAKYFRKKSSN